MALAGEKQASVPCRPSMAARGGGPGGGWGRTRVPIGGSRAATDGRRKKRRGEGVFLSRCVSFSFLGAGGNTLFWENLGKTLRPARRVASRRHTSAPPLLLRLPVGFINPCRPGQLQEGCVSTYLPYSMFTGFTRLLRHMADGSVCPHLFLKLYGRALERLGPV